MGCMFFLLSFFPLSFSFPSKEELRREDEQKQLLLLPPCYPSLLRTVVDNLQCLSADFASTYEVCLPVSSSRGHESQLQQLSALVPICHPMS